MANLGQRERHIVEGDGGRPGGTVELEGPQGGRQMAAIAIAATAAWSWTLQACEVQVGEVHPGLAHEGHTADAAAEVQHHGGGGRRCSILKGVDGGHEEQGHPHADAAVLAGGQLHDVTDARALPDAYGGGEDGHHRGDRGRAAGDISGYSHQGVGQPRRRGHDVQRYWHRGESVGGAAAPRYRVYAEAGVLAEVGGGRCGGGEGEVDVDGGRGSQAPPGQRVGVELGDQVQAGEGRGEVAGIGDACAQRWWWWVSGWFVGLLV